MVAELVPQKVFDYIRTKNLTAGERRLVVAVSGGPDSVCLLHVLYQLQEKLGVELHVAHLNHQLRGAESDADADYVASLARQLNLLATIERRDVATYKETRRVSLEEAARDVRYDFLSQAARAVGADRVAVGHTTDDHIETILMHLIRGSGTRGLRGLQPQSRWRPLSDNFNIIRPLLPVSRQETLEYCRFYHLKPRLDTSNLSLSPLRNRIRLQLLPRLKGYNPRITDALLRTASIAEDDIAFIEEQAAILWPSVAHMEDNTVILDKDKFAALLPNRQRHLLLLSLEKLLGAPYDFEMRHIEQLLAALNKPSGRRIHLPGGVVFSIEYGRYLISSGLPAITPFPVISGEYPLEVPGKTEIPGWRVASSMMAPAEVNKEDDRFCEYFDYDWVGGKVLVRNWRPGDSFQPLGMTQTKKLGKFMIDARIPSQWRSRVPVVVSPQQVLWLVGWRVDERVKVSDNTQRVLCLKFQRIE